MPDMNGLETIRHVQESRPATPIIIASGYHARVESIPNFAKTTTKLGAVYRLQKPFRPADLMAAVNSCLSTSLPPEIVPSTSSVKS